MQVFRDLFKFLTFRFKNEDYERIGWPHLLVGAIFTLLVGVARNWDYSDAPAYAEFGLASLAYIVLLAFVLWMSAMVFCGYTMSYIKVLALVAMTAPPGLIYGIPVERMLSLEDATAANWWFLAFVAAYRVALAVHFMIHLVPESVFKALLALLTPISGVIVYLTMTGRTKYVLDLMGGQREEPTSQDSVNATIALLGCFAYPIFIAGTGTIIVMGITRIYEAYKER